MATTLNRENAMCRWLTDRQAQQPAGAEEMGYCSPDFDKSLCWFNVSLGAEGQRRCPFSFCPTIPGCEDAAKAYHATRQCNENGTWGESVYQQCIDLVSSSQHQHCVVGFCRTCPDPLRETVIRVSLSLSIVSVAVLLSALVLFSVFDAVQCRRLSIHKNLAAAFVFRFAVLAVWTLVNSQNVFRDCTKFAPAPLLEWEWACKMLLWMVIYFQVASVIWMAIEGIYLYSRFTVFAMRRSEAPYVLYLVTGWGLPFVVVMAWTVVHELQLRPGSYCWLPYAYGAHLWILAGTMGAALILNVLLLLAIIFILIQKLRNESTAESKKIWRTVKATILLVPLLGVSNIPLFYEPAQPSAFYMLGSAILQHSQGIFIAVLYCFLNGEIQNAVRRQCSKVPLLRSLGFPSRQRLFETERTYLPAQTTDAGEANGHMQMRDMRCRNGAQSQRTAKYRPNGTVQSSSLNADLSAEALKQRLEGTADGGVMSCSLGPIELGQRIGDQTEEEEEPRPNQRLIW